MRRYQLLRLYPRRWRERYGEEFLATMQDGPLRVSQVIDIVRGAIDAWLLPQVRSGARVARTAGGPMTSKTLVCDTRPAGVTIRDALIGAGVMLGVTAVLKVAGFVAAQEGLLHLRDELRALVFPVSFTASMPFWLMKGAPWKIQLAIVAGTLAFLVLLNWR